jgi:glycosyltransferase involved in cell wall biosynthesis
MKILHLNTYDIRGGAARATYRLHRALQQAGHESTLLVREKRSNDPTVLTFKPSKNIFKRLRRRLRRSKIARDFARYQKTRPEGLELFTDDRSAECDAIVQSLPPSDLINLHWVAGIFDYNYFFKNAPQNIPFVWRLADLNVLTGGCHYDDGCGKFTSGCGSCPQLGSDRRSDLSRMIFERKLATFESLNFSRLHIVATSRWLSGQVQKSPLLKRFPVSVIPNTIDHTEFAPRDRHFSRDYLGLPQNAKVVLFVSDSLLTKRKGLAYLAQALDGLHSVGTIMLLSAGSGKIDLASSIPNLHMGYITNDRLLSVIYSAADICVVPSVQETFGQTALESMSCGVPVVGFDTGGIQDTVRHGQTGLLVPFADVNALRDAISELLGNDSTARSMGEKGRQIVLDEYTYTHISQRYLQLYQTIIAKCPVRLSAARFIFGSPP